MARLASRRTRSPEPDTDEDSRPQTPISTAPNDSKRVRLSRTGDVEDGDGDEGEESEPSQPQEQTARLRKSRSDVKPVLVNGHIAAGGHQPGAIVRIKLTNFVTYTSAEFFPGPSLNMVIGPNGTGKSTLVCAICLGLGWGTQFLGRAKDVSEFVKHGCREATIEIELAHATTRRNPIISRTIKRDGNKGAFTLNGHPSTQKAIQNFAQGFNIQIDNLCQFLPQDKVVEFAQMTPIDVLESTQQAAGSREMLKRHEELKALRLEQKDLLQSNKGDREQLDNLEKRQQMQEAEVERMRERAVAKRKLEWLEKCRPVPEYIAAKNAWNRAKERQRTLEAELKILRDQSRPVLQKLDAKKNYKTDREQLVKRRHDALLDAEKKCKDVEKELERLGNQVKDCDHNYNAERKNIQPKKQEHLKIQRKIAELKNRLKEKPPAIDSRAINQEIQDRRQEVRDLDNKKEEVRSRESVLHEQRTRRRTEAQKVEQKIRNLDSESGRQESQLENLSADTYKAWKWIQSNQALFEKPVFGPPLVECSLKDPAMADAIESFLQEGDFKIITVQTEKDFALLQRKLNREQGLIDIRIRTCSIENLDQFRRPLSPRDMQAMGLSSYAIDHLNGPSPVIAMLCNEKNLHQCAVATGSVSNDQHDQISKSALKNYFAGGQCYQFIRRAEYNQSISRVRQARPARMWTNRPVDLGRKAALERERAQLIGETDVAQQEIGKCDTEKKSITEQQAKLKEEIDSMTKDKDEKQRALTEWNALPTKIGSEEKKAQDIQDWMNGIRERLNEITAAKDEALLKQADIALKFAQATRVIKIAISSELEAEVMLIEATSDFEVLKERDQHIVTSINQKQNEEENAVVEYRTNHKKAKELASQINELMKEAKKQAEEGQPGFHELLEHAANNNMTMDTLNAEIDSQKAQIELTEGGNANVIKEFEDRAKAIEKLRDRLSSFNQKQADFQHAINEVRSHWEPPLDALVSKISDAFADSFARIDCAGQVAVYKASSDDPADCTEENGGAENGLDFANWAIHISVKFRDNEPLSLLDSHRQSGGERAVSTIFYLMALQSLSRAPFRVVDEINQGMDPRNERTVHGRMVDVATSEGGSQYFLITPKLLSGLKYKRGMTVLCIVSGENVPGDTMPDGQGGEIETPQLDFKAFARRAREIGLGSAIGGRRIDSGVGMENSFDSDGLLSGRTTEVGA